MTNGKGCDDCTDECTGLSQRVLLMEKGVMIAHNMIVLIVPPGPNGKECTVIVLYLSDIIQTCIYNEKRPVSLSVMVCCATS